MSFWAPWTVWPNLKHTASVTGSQTAGRKPRAISRCKRFSTCACAFVVSLGNCGNNVHMAWSILTVFQNFRAVVGFWWRYPDVFCQGGDETNSRGEGVQDARELASREGFLMICIILWLYRYGIIYLKLLLWCYCLLSWFRLDFVCWLSRSKLERFNKLNPWPWLRVSSPEALHIWASLSSRPSSGLFEREELMLTHTPRRLLFLPGLVHLLFLSSFLLINKLKDAVDVRWPIDVTSLFTMFSLSRFEFCDCGKPGPWNTVHHSAAFVFVAYCKERAVVLVRIWRFFWSLIIRISSRSSRSETWECKERPFLL